MKNKKIRKQITNVLAAHQGKKQAKRMMKLAIIVRDGNQINVCYENGSMDIYKIVQTLEFVSNFD